jgi:hypothetical protein
MSRSRTLRISALALVAALAVAVAAAAASRPSVHFTAPKAGAKTSTKVAAKVRLSHFVLDPKHVGKRNQANHGHLHFSLDNGKYDFAKYSGANGKLAAQLGVAGKYSPSVTRSITYKGLPNGRHVLRVYCANNDHTEIKGTATTVVFTVR